MRAVFAATAAVLAAAGVAKLLFLGDAEGWVLLIGALLFVMPFLQGREDRRDKG